MFETLSDRLNDVFQRIGKKGRLTEPDVDEAMREVRRALLEADVNFKVVRDFVTAVRERAVGEDVLKALTPAQQVISIVNEELIKVLGSERVPLANRIASANDHHARRTSGLGQDDTRRQACQPSRRRKGASPCWSRRTSTARRPSISSRRLASQINIPGACRGDTESPVKIAEQRDQACQERGAIARSSSTPPVACRSTNA